MDPAFLPLTSVRSRDPSPDPIEWPSDLDVSALLTTGWRPTPIRQFVVKVHSRCNLACDYCYVYEMSDQTWRDRPRIMSTATAGRVARRIAEHASTHGLRRVEIVLHGGEPLLVGPAHLAELAAQFRTLDDLEVGLALQTNGVLLDAEVLAVAHRYDIRIGVSVDGAATDHDRHRRFPAGHGSHHLVERALGRLTEEANRRLFGGLLCVVDLRADPVDTHAELVRFSPPAIDFLLPHGNWTDRPPGRTDEAGTPYGDWLIAVFDRWYHDQGAGTEIRLFREIMQLLLGGRSAVETVGLSPASLLVVETDGSLEQVDSLKSAYHGASGTGLSVWRHSVDTAVLHPAVVARQIGAAALGDRCQPCGIKAVCGGGYYPHRYRKGTGFRNPSVYCSDLMALIGHIRAVVQADLEQLRCGR
jgi:uncharacterized protein